MCFLTGFSAVHELTIKTQIFCFYLQPYLKKYIFNVVKKYSRLLSGRPMPLDESGKKNNSLLSRTIFLSYISGLFDVPALCL